ncbi:MAG: hypothetical protein LH650_16325 [Chloroflexi bacterium]|nr:hypothetical protein [Chloroflexota bacterium]
MTIRTPSRTGDAADVDQMTSATRVLADQGHGSDDAQLVVAALADRARSAVIYERYRLPVYRYLRALGSTTIPPQT